MRSANVALALRVFKNLAIALVLINASAERNDVRSVQDVYMLIQPTFSSNNEDSLNILYFYV